MNPIVETQSNVISESTEIVGKLHCTSFTRFHGTIKGEILAADGSTLVLSESSVVEGNIHGETIFVSGYVRGEIRARTKVVITPSGRVIGNIITPKFKMEFGGFLEGRCTMEEHTPLADPSLSLTA